MKLDKAKLWRIDFRTDASRSKSAVIPLAYMIEAECDDGNLYHGLLYRPRLIEAELAHVNRLTWPELDDLAGFLKPMLQVASVSEGGAAALLERFSPRSAVQVTSPPLPRRFANELGAHAGDKAGLAAIEGLMRKHFEAKLSPTFPPTGRAAREPTKAAARSRPHSRPTKVTSRSAHLRWETDSHHQEHHATA